jgi:hypothetical protein
METVVEFEGALCGTNTSAKWLSADAEGSTKISFEVPASEYNAVTRLIEAHGKLIKFTLQF